MKRLITMGVCLLIAGGISAQEEKITDGYLIEGVISGDYKGKVYLTSESSIKGQQTNIDSCEVVGGKYTFKGPNVDVVTIHFIKSEDGQITPLFLENGHIRISTRANNFMWADVQGTANNDIRNFYNFWNRAVIDSMIKSTSIDWKLFGRSDMDTEDEKYKKRSAMLKNRHLGIQDEFVRRFNDQPFAPFMIMFEMISDLPVDKIKELRTQLNPGLNNHPYTKALDEFIEMQNFKVGSKAYDFRLPGLDGQPIALKNYEGKYILLDFWASWCGPCRGEAPNIIKLYKNCKGKNFEIIGISLDTKEDAWKSAIKEMKMTWPQACDLKGWTSTVVSRYNVRAVPRTVLIDPQGKVIAIDLRGEQLTEKVKALIK